MSPFSRVVVGEINLSEPYLITCDVLLCRNNTDIYWFDFVLTKGEPDDLTKYLNLNGVACYKSVNYKGNSVTTTWIFDRGQILTKVKLLEQVRGVKLEQDLIGSLVLEVL